MQNNKIPTKEDLQERFAEELHLEHLPLESQNEVLLSLSKIIIERITMELMLLLPEKEFKKVDKLVQEGAEADLSELIDKHIPNMSAVIEQVIIRALSEFKTASQNT